LKNNIYKNIKDFYINVLIKISVVDYFSF